MPDTRSRLPAVLIIASFAGVLAIVLSVVDAPTVSQSAQTAAADVGVAETQGGSAGLAVGWLLVEIGLVVGVVGCIALYRRLSGRWQWWARRVFLGGIFAAAIVYVVGVFEPATATQTLALAVAVVAAGVSVRVLDRVGVWWPVYDALGLLLAAWGAIALGHIFPPALFAVLAVAWLVYDHLAADRSTAMHSAAGALLRWRVPVLVIVPDRWRYSTRELADTLSGKGGEFGGAGLGVGDYALAGAFAAGIAIGGQALLAWGVALTGVGGLAAGLLLRSGGGAGLPWIFGAMVPAWGAGVLV